MTDLRAVAAGRAGQSLVELLVALGIGTILFSGTAAMLAPTLQINKESRQVQTASNLGRGLLDNVRVWASGNWHNILALATSSANPYYLLTSTSPYTATSGVESVTVSTSTYTRYFYVNDVYRDPSGNVTSTSGGGVNTYDPSTKAIAVVYDWTHGATTTLSSYLTRNRANVLSQTSWAGGPGLVGPVASPGWQFATSSQMTYSNSQGTLAAAVTSSSAAWPNNYQYRRSITVATNEISPINGTALTNFPMLISGTYSYLAASSSGGMVQNGNGYDIIFTSDASGTNALAFERESYNATTGAINFWVKVPALSSSSNVIYMFYDNASTTSDTSNATGTWNSNYAAVYHMASSSSTIIYDSTANANNLTSYNSPVATSSGEIDGAVSYPNSNQYSGVYSQNTNNPSIPGTNATISSWVNIKSFFGYDSLAGTIFSVGTSTAPGYTMGFIGGTSSVLGFGMDYNWTNFNLLYPGTVATDTWYYLTGVVSGTLASFYVDGSFVTSTAVNTPETMSNICINESTPCVVPYPNNRSVNDITDESRILTTSLSPDWISTEYNNQSSPGTFYTVGAQMSYGASASIGTLESPIFDTGETAGAQFNSILWQGTQAGSSSVEFQFATSNATSGPWTFTGPDGTGNTYYTPVGSGDAASLSQTLYDNNRYFRYLVVIVPSGSQSSVISSITVNWSP